MARHFGHAEREKPRRRAGFGCVVLGIVAAFVMAAALLGFIIMAWARDDGQWENVDQRTREWFQRLLQPDTVSRSKETGEINGVPCCGEADSYWVRINVRQNWITGIQLVATIDDDRDDEPLKRAHEENGTQYVVPPNKIVGREQEIGNPTGHVLLFLGAVTMVGDIGDQHRAYPRPVLCFVNNAGN